MNRAFAVEETIPHRVGTREPARSWRKPAPAALLLALGILALGCLSGCNLPLTRGTMLVAKPDSHVIASVQWTPLPDADHDAMQATSEQHLAEGLRGLPADAAVRYRRHWAANLTFVFTARHVSPAADRISPPVSRTEPRSLILVALRLKESPPAGALPACGPDGSILLLVGCDALPTQTPSGPWSLRFGAWPDLTGEPGSLSCWDPVRLQVEDPGIISRPIVCSGLVIDQATWASLSSNTLGSTLAAAPLRSTSFVVSRNPLRWLATPVTLLVDAFLFGDDDGERHRHWMTNRWDFDVSPK